MLYGTENRMDIRASYACHMRSSLEALVFLLCLHCMPHMRVPVIRSHPVPPTHTPTNQSPLSYSTTTILSSLSAFDNVDGYMFPCAANSPYALNNSIACDTAEVQVKRTLDFLAEDGIGVQGSSLQPTPYFPLRATLGRIWIDIEDESPSKYFSPTIKDNTDLLDAYVGALEGYGITVGLYTTKTYWKNIMGDVEGYGTYVVHVVVCGSTYGNTCGSACGIVCADDVYRDTETEGRRRGLWCVVKSFLMCQSHMLTQYPENHYYIHTQTQLTT